MAITFQLPNFPLVNQNHEPTSDGYPDENASWNCVPASLSAGLTFLTGQTFNGDELKDATYGQNYRGGQSARNYIAYCAQRGVDLVSYKGTPAQLVATIHAEVALGHPVVLTMPSQWGIPVAQQGPHTTHVGVAYGLGPSEVRVMNPWIAPTPHDGTDAYWAARLEDNEVWIMRHAAAKPVIPGSSSVSFPGAIQIPSPNHWPGHAGAAPRWIIIHGTAGGASAQAIGQYFQGTPTPGTATHYVVGRDGAVVQCVSEQDSAWGNGPISAGAAPWWSGVVNGNPNWVTFSIEHVKPSTDNSDTLTPAQQAASFALVKHLCDAWGIPPRAADANGGITGHFSIDPVNRTYCPGPYPWQALYAYLAAGGATTVTVPQGWTDDGTTLTAPASDGIGGGKLSGGFRLHVLGDPNWDPRNVPIGTEYSDGKGGSKQECRWLRFAWSPLNALGVVIEADARGIADAQRARADAAEAHAKIAQDALDAAHAQVASLSKQISDLQTQLAADAASDAALAQQVNDLSAKSAADDLRIADLTAQLAALAAQQGSPLADAAIKALKAALQ